MVVQHNAYLKLLDEAASIDPAKGMAEELSKLSQDPIDKDDTLKLLLLAEFAMQARQWQAAAQLFARVMVNPFRLHYSETVFGRACVPRDSPDDATSRRSQLGHRSAAL